jgi:hypothetical protein
VSCEVGDLRGVAQLQVRALREGDAGLDAIKISSLLVYGAHDTHVFVLPGGLVHYVGPRRTKQKNNKGVSDAVMLTGIEFMCFLI